MKYGILLIIISLISGYLSTHMFGDIGVAGMIGSIAIFLSGLGFTNLANQEKK